MKRVFRISALLLVLLIALSATTLFASAATSTIPVVYGVKMNSGYTIRMNDSSIEETAGHIQGKSRAAFKNVEKIDLSFKGVVGKAYMVFLLKSTDADTNETETNLVPTADNVFYIDQITATGSDTVTIYPKDLQTAGHYRIYVAGSGTYSCAGYLNVADSWEEYSYLLGDVNGNGVVDLADAMQALKNYVGLIALDDEAKERGDVAQSGHTGAHTVDMADAMKILKRYLGISVSIEEG